MATATAPATAAPGLDLTKLSKDISIYSDLQRDRLNYRPVLPGTLNGPFKVEHGPPTTSAGNPGKMALNSMHPNPKMEGLMDGIMT